MGTELCICILYIPIYLSYIWLPRHGHDESLDNKLANSNWITLAFTVLFRHF